MFTKEKALALLCLGFFFCLIISCTDKRSPEKPSAPPVENPFPFDVTKVTPVELEEENRRYCIQAPVGEIDGYYELFEEYGFGGNGPSWVEHISAILDEKDPQVLDHLEFDEEGDTFLVYADSEEIVNRFMKAVHPVFANKKSLKKYLSKADPDNFSE
ncbi:hypothetical protein GCM10028822_20750 [Hymenobacter terrigena]